MEELMLKKSIFKQEQFKETYEKYYNSDGSPDLYPSRNSEKTGEDYVYECNLSMPLLKFNDLFYIEEYDKTVGIKQVIRTSKDNVLYLCYPNTIEDKESYNKIREELRKEKEEWKLKQPKEESKAEIKGIRKFIKKLFNL